MAIDYAAMQFDKVSADRIGLQYCFQASWGLKFSV